MLGFRLLVGFYIGLGLRVLVFQDFRVLGVGGLGLWV